MRTIEHVLWGGSLIATVVVLACTPARTPPPASEAAPQMSPVTASSPQLDDRAIADFYRGKTIRFVVGFAPGGAFDLYSRLLAKHMPKHLPGNPTMVVENRPGAGSALAANLVFNTEPKDGTVIASINEFLVLQQLLGAPGMEFDAARFQWLGSSVDTFSTCVARADAPITRIEDLIAGRELVVGTTGPGAATHDGPAVLNSALGTRFRLVSGYEGIATINLALESREVDGFCVSFDALTIVARQQFDRNPPGLKVLVVFGDRTADHPWLRGVPAAEQLARTPEARQLLRTIHGPSRMSKPFAVAPGVPSDRVEALRRAMAASFADPDLIAEAQRSALEVSARGGADVAAVVAELQAAPPEVVGRLKEILQ